jgi:LysR family carnitine catabolism transcriptional activator
MAVRLTDIAMAQAHASPTAIVEARNIATAGGIIAAGLGVSAFPEMALPLLQHAPVTTMPLTGPALYRDIAVLTPRDNPIPPAALLLIEILRDTLA